MIMIVVFLSLVLFQFCCRRRCYPNNNYYDCSRIPPPENRGRDGRARLVSKRGTGSRKYVRARYDDVQSRGARALAIHPRLRGSPAARNAGILVWILWLDTLRCCCSVDWIDVVKGAGADGAGVGWVAVRGGGDGRRKAEGLNTDTVLGIKRSLRVLTLVMAVTFHSLK